MSEVKRAAITAVGHYAPPDILDNKYFESILDTTDEWIRERTGIVERRVLKEGATSDLAAPAIRQTLERRGIGPEEIDLIVVATTTPDMLFPSTACVLQDKVGLKNAYGFDVAAACSGFVFALEVGQKYIQAGSAKKVLVVGADKMTSIANYQDRNTAILFGDAAGVVLLEPTEDESVGIMDIELHVDGTGGRYLYMAAGGSANPATMETVANNMHYVTQDGRAVFKVAVVGMADVAESIMKRNNLTADDVRWLVPHQANKRILTATAERMGLPVERVMINIDRFGNTTAATIPMCLSQWWENGQIDKGDGLVLATFGAGYTWGAAFVRWAY